MNIIIYKIRTIYVGQIQGVIGWLGCVQGFVEVLGHIWGVVKWSGHVLGFIDALGCV